MLENALFKMQVVWGKCTRTYHPRRCKRNRLTNIESLPDDLLLGILARVPALDIHSRTRLVCRKWYHMIHTRNFLHAHLQHTTYGLLFQGLCSLCFVVLQQGRIEISKIDHKPRLLVQGSCNGFYIDEEPHSGLCLRITNPVLKQEFILPPIHPPIRSLHNWSYGIAYSAATQEYKVFQTYCNDIGWVQPCSILAVGVDNSWRDLDTKHLSVEAKKVFVKPPLITEGFMHWALDGIQVLTLNVETEIITETPAPIPRVYGGQNRKMYYYLSGGRYLSLLVACKKFRFEVWEMKPERGEWRKVCSIVLEGQECKFEECGLKEDEYLMPVGWLKYLEVLAFGTKKGQTFIFYNLVTQEINLFKPPAATWDQQALLCGHYRPPPEARVIGEQPPPVEQQPPVEVSVIGELQQQPVRIGDGTTSGGSSGGGGWGIGGSSRCPMRVKAVAVLRGEGVFGCIYFAQDGDA